MYSIIWWIDIDSIPSFDHFSSNSFGSAAEDKLRTEKNPLKLPTSRNMRSNEVQNMRMKHKTILLESLGQGHRYAFHRSLEAIALLSSTKLNNSNRMMM